MSLPSTKKVCINSSKNYYTGTELSPLHFGLSAEGYDINSIMEGYDNELWIVDIKNNKKIWVKNEYLSRITYEEPVIKNILSTSENIGCDINELNFKDNIYHLKEINEIKENNSNSEINCCVEKKDDTCDTCEDNKDECINNGSLQSDSVNKNIKNDKKPTDYNIFVKFRLNELKDFSKNKKGNFENVKVEWRELKKNKSQLKVVMDKAKMWLNANNIKN